MFRFAWPVDDAAHHRDLQFFNPCVGVAPNRHLLAYIILYVFGHLLKERTRRSSTTGTGGHQWRETSETHGLQDLLRDDDLFCAVAVGTRGERNANCIAYALLQQNGKRGARRDDAFTAHPGF